MMSTPWSVLSRSTANLYKRARGEGRLSAGVVGAAFTGIEIAMELVDRLGAVAAARRPIRASRHSHRYRFRGRSGAGTGPRPEIQKALEQLGVEFRLNTRIVSLSPDTMELEDGTTLPAQTVIWTAGIFASPLTGSISAERDRIGRIFVYDFLGGPTDPSIYVAGDTLTALRAARKNTRLPRLPTP